MFTEIVPEITDLPVIDLYLSPEEHWQCLKEKCNSKPGLSLDMELIEKGFHFMIKAHEGKRRKTGELYYTHPLLTALYFIHIFDIADTSSVIACLLHDTVEDSENRKVKMQEIIDQFGTDTAGLVKGLTNIRGTKSDEASSFGKLLIAMISDFRVILVKLCDRLHNMLTLDSHTPAKQIIISEETLEFFVPAAQWIGKKALKSVLEEKAFSYIDSEAFNFIQKEITQKKLTFLSDKYIRELLERMGNLLNQYGIDHFITIEHKNKYELYRMAKGDKNKIPKIDNFYSIVISVKENDTPFCYFAMGVLLKFFKQIGFKDYISYPKFNSFQSLIIYLINTDGKKIEVLIRTNEMDNIANEGLFKSGRLSPFESLNLSEEELESLDKWIKSLIHKYGENATETIWRMIKNNLFSEEVNVFSKGNYYRLPKSATLIDLAFMIDKEKALYFTGGNVSGTSHSFYYTLKNGDIVDMEYSPQPTIIRDWVDNAVLFKSIIEMNKHLKVY